MTHEDIRTAATLVAEKYGPDLSEWDFSNHVGEVVTYAERNLHHDRLWANYLLVRREVQSR